MPWPLSALHPGDSYATPDTCTTREAQPSVKGPQTLFLIQIIYDDLII